MTTLEKIDIMHNKNSVIILYVLAIILFFGFFILFMNLAYLIHPENDSFSISYTNNDMIFALFKLFHY